MSNPSFLPRKFDHSANPALPCIFLCGLCQELCAPRLATRPRRRPTSSSHATVRTTARPAPASARRNVLAPCTSRFCQAMSMSAFVCDSMCVRTILMLCVCVCVCVCVRVCVLFCDCVLIRPQRAWLPPLHVYACCDVVALCSNRFYDNVYM
jgi:hypothetical protein